MPVANAAGNVSFLRGPEAVRVSGVPGAPGADPAQAKAAPAAARPSGPPDLRKANLIILSVDTLRADATQMLGGPPEITPAMAEFASHGVLFTHARSQAPQTAPSHMSLFTSTYPSVHGVENAAHEPVEGAPDALVTVPLPADIPTLAEILRAAGFRSRALTEAGNLLPGHGFDRGFETYEAELVGAAVQVDRGIDILEDLAAPGSQRFFCFWHTYQCHAPYVPPEPFAERWAPADYRGPLKARLGQLGETSFQERIHVMGTLFRQFGAKLGVQEQRYLHGLYHGAVSYADSELLRLFAAMEELGVFDSSIVVLLSDHGEAFHEHGHWQHEDCYEECLRVPLIIRFPGDFMAGRRIDVPVALIDVMPTVLDLLSVDTASLDLPGRVRQCGISLAGPLLHGTEPAARPIISEHRATHGGLYDKLVAIYSNGMKFIQDEVRGEVREGGKKWMRRELYDLEQDPGEKHDLAPEGGQRLRDFVKLYATFSTVVRAREQSGQPSSPTGVSSPDQAEALRQLGYIR
jgi:arylsulfatase A-like enzyme